MGRFALDVSLDVFTTVVSEVAQGAKAQANKLFVEGVELAEGRDVGDRASGDNDVPLKRTLGWDQAAQEMGDLGIMDFDGIDPVTKRCKEHVKHLQNHWALLKVVADWRSGLGQQRRNGSRHSQDSDG